MTYTIEGTELGYIQSESISSSSGLTPIALPDTDASDQLLIPTTGPVVRISIRGIKTGNTATIQTFVDNLKDWTAKGGKISESNLTYNSDLNGSFSVRVIDGNWEYTAESSNKLSYSLVMIQGSFS